jgi:glycosyltransferase involved in cell wall biosynthesis
MIERPMRILEEATVFACGDPNAPSTWSNIPHFLVETLRRSQVRVNTVDLAPSRFLKRTYDALVRLPLRLAQPQSAYAYLRTPIHEWDVTRRIGEAVRSYPASQLNLFLTFTFTGSRHSAMPSVQICDWPFEYHIRHFLQRDPTPLEREAIRRERRNMEDSSLVVSLFAGVAKYLSSSYPGAHSVYLGHVINTTQTPTQQLPDLKAESKDVLFIGGSHYRRGVENLIEAFDRMKRDQPDLRLHIIGMTEQQVGRSASGVSYYGYLDKGKPEDEAKYYELVRRARVIVNPTPRWGGFSSLVEAMYFYTPVVTTPYGEFVETFGSDLPFGFYCEEDSVPTLSIALGKAIAEVGYRDRCLGAHHAARPHTWTAFVTKLMSELKFELPGNR